MSSPPLTFDAPLAEHERVSFVLAAEATGYRCTCGETLVGSATWADFMHAPGGVTEAAQLAHRAHLAAVLLAHVREAHEGLIDATEFGDPGSGRRALTLFADRLRALTEETR